MKPSGFLSPFCDTLTFSTWSHLPKRDQITDFHSMNISNLVQEGEKVGGGGTSWRDASFLHRLISNWANRNSRLHKRKLLPQARGEVKRPQTPAENYGINSLLSALTSAAIPFISLSPRSTRGALIESGRDICRAQRCCLTSLREQTFLDP